MEDTLSQIRELIAAGREYIETSVDSVKLTAAEKISLVISKLVAGTLVTVVFFFFLLFASVAGALALSSWLQLAWGGWLIVASFYLLIGFLVLAVREPWIRIPVMNNIIRQLFKDDEKDEND